MPSRKATTSGSGNIAVVIPATSKGSGTRRGPSARPIASGTTAWVMTVGTIPPLPSSERPHDHQDDDDRGGDARHLVHRPQRLVAVGTETARHLLGIAHRPAMISRQQQH